MDRWLAVWSSRAAGTVVVLWALSGAWWTLLWVTAVVVGAVALCRHVDTRHQGTVPPGGRVVLITGCDSGIGREAAIVASQRGMTVVAGCLDVHGAESLAVMDRVHVLHLDVTDDVSIAKAVQEVTSICGDKGLWGLVNNAGLNRQSPVELTSMTTFQRLADVMLFGTVRVTKAFLPLLRRAKGRVVNMSSDRGLMSPANSAAYCITKHGVETFSDVLRAEMTSFDFDVTVSIMQIGHFGGATAIIDDRNMDAMKANMEEDWAQCTPEVQRAYGGQRVVQNILDETRASRKTSPSDITPVVNAILHSLLSTNPQERYQIHGGVGMVDWGLVLGWLKPLLPLVVFKPAEKMLWR